MDAAGRRHEAGAEQVRATRLGFALLLKFFEVETRFPESAQEVPTAAVEYVAQQVEVPAEAWADYGCWNSANKDLFYGKDGDLVGQDKESQEVSMLALRLLQSALVHVNTLLMQQVLADPKWADTLTDADRRALSPLFWTRVNPCGRFELDMNRRLDLDLTARDAVPRPRAPEGRPAAAPG
ncbi:Tn3 family transposase [Streptomyces sp. NPDC085946]|uniref:Tn3 family transposase n=1 Tax=Streptomyces sp. NPDC085946 TaxID=3365744 RepID=UPI0037D90829